MSRFSLRLVLVVLFWYCAGAVFAQVTGEEAEMDRLQTRAEESIANGDPDGAAMNMGKAALMASQLAKRNANAGQSQWRGAEALFRAEEQAYRALALFQRAGGQPPASSGVCGSMRLAKEHLDTSVALLVDAAPRDGRLQSASAEWVKTLEGLNADFQCR